MGDEVDVQLRNNAIHELQRQARETLDNPLIIYNRVAQFYLREIIAGIGASRGIEIINQERPLLQPMMINNLFNLGVILEVFEPVRDFFQRMFMSDEGDIALIFAKQRMIEQLNAAQDIYIQEPFTTLFKNWQNNNLIGAPINILYRSWTLAITHYQHFGEALDSIEPYCQLISNDFPTVINFFHFLRYDWGKILKELVEIRSSVSYTHLDSFVMTLSNKIGGAHENSWTWIANLIKVVDDEEQRWLNLQNQIANAPNLQPDIIPIQKIKEIQLNLAEGRLTLEEFINNVLMPVTCLDLENYITIITNNHLECTLCDAHDLRNINRDNLEDNEQPANEALEERNLGEFENIPVQNAAPGRGRVRGRSRARGHNRPRGRGQAGGRRQEIIEEHNQKRNLNAHLIVISDNDTDSSDQSRSPSPHRRRRIVNEIDAGQILIRPVGENSIQPVVANPENDLIRREPEEYAANSRRLPCVICLDHERDMLLQPCGHVSMCVGCSSQTVRERMDFCPVCRKNVVSRTYLRIS
ncbi:hypothetical protein KQX54_016219 [Cotesia glomerata]|uniref:RING-type domain-containing protein n=1 Tax=Cotesia glomerata TaxID=32391 RepID=A0AAV7J7X3_COTGL|nr:hypothetical protein KQX54_016219 [Cotesia glomerata]